MQALRNTPTGVGKTRIVSERSPDNRKHPHGRGEDLFDLDGTVIDSETPPRAWGRLVQTFGLYACCRNTPTGVGKTVRHALGSLVG